MIKDKIQAIKTMLPVGADISEDRLVAFLDMAKEEILSWLYNGEIPEGITDVPAKYERVQIHAVVIGIGIIGGTGETAHAESGISRTFKYTDMVDYIHKNVFQYARFL